SKAVTKVVKGKKVTAPASMSGEFRLINVDRSTTLCSRDDSRPHTKTGKWRIRQIQGTRVLELKTESSIAPDVGIQPVNADSVNLGFAEIEAPQFGAPAKRAKNQPAETMVVPVIILKNNQPIVDFRLKFNDKAAAAIRPLVLQAESVRTGVPVSQLAAKASPKPAAKPAAKAAPKKAKAARK
ncbi:MAG: hypothetical protein HUK26_00380, partial [Duodenibacillus sp.]|nr:hypothetical protein [Duodenibacillus sp.]